MLISWWPRLIGCWALLIKALRLSWPAGPWLSRDSLGSDSLGKQSLPRPALVCVCLLISFCCFVSPLDAAPGLCLGPVCGDQFSRSPQFPWQLRLRVSDQSGQRERLVVDCRDGSISPRQGPVERGYAAAVARRACRLAPSSASPAEPAGLSTPELLPAQLPMAALQLT
jgi:hypothetical protein